MVPDQSSAKKNIKSSVVMFLTTVIFCERASKLDKKSSLSVTLPVVRIL